MNDMVGEGIPNLGDFFASYNDSTRAIFGLKI